MDASKVNEARLRRITLGKEKCHDMSRNIRKKVKTNNVLSHCNNNENINKWLNIWFIVWYLSKCITTKIERGISRKILFNGKVVVFWGDFK